MISRARLMHIKHGQVQCSRAVIGERVKVAPLAKGGPFGLRGSSG